MFRLGASAMAGCSAFERFDNFAGNVSNEELGHDVSMLSCDSIENKIRATPV
jgi:hypothetical protein